MIKTKRTTAAVWRRLAGVPAIAALIVLGAAIALAAAPANSKNHHKEKKRRIIPVTINKGQNFTISNVKEGTSAAPHVVDNANALVVQNAPGRIELVGADKGEWKIDVTLASGEKVTYKVTVNALAPPQGSLAPATAPTAIAQ